LACSHGGKEIESWPIELVPDADLLFMRVHHNNIREGRLLPLVFLNHGEGEEDGMSTDWNKYSTPEETRNRVYKDKPTWKGGVIQMVAGEVRKIPNQVVQHAPLTDNRAHTNVKGRKDTQVRYLFMRSWTWVIRCE
jgi:hypothetical protein